MSGLTGFIGMSLAVRGNVRTAAAATTGSMPRRPAGGVPHRRRRRHVHRRPRPARRHRHHHDLPEHQLGDPHRLRLRRLAAGPVPAGRRRHLHQGGRRRRRPRRQGRGRHPRGRPPQPGHHRRQRRRQRRRLRRHGRRPVRELRGHPGRLDHPRRPGLPAHLPRRARAVGRRRSSSRWPPGPSACWPRSSASSRCGPRDNDKSAMAPINRGFLTAGILTVHRHAGRRPRLRRQPRRAPIANVGLAHVRRGRHRPGPGPGRQPHHRVLHLDRDRRRCRRSPRRPAPARPPPCWPASRRASSRRCGPSSPSPSPSASPSASAAATSSSRFYLVALTGMGMLATTGVVVSEDTFGPVADNAAGIAEMSGEFDGEPERIMVEPRRRGQHHQGRHQGLRHRLGRHRRRGPVRQLHRDDRHRARRPTSSRRRGHVRRHLRRTSRSTWPTRRPSSAC